MCSSEVTTLHGLPWCILPEFSVSFRKQYRPSFIVITTPLGCSLYEPNDLEICFIGLAWLTRLELEERRVGFLSQALNMTRSVEVYFVLL